MTLIGRTTHEEVNGEITRDSGCLLGIKGIRYFCGSNETGARCTQIGPLVLEIWSH